VFNPIFKSSLLGSIALFGAVEVSGQITADFDNHLDHTSVYYTGQFNGVVDAVDAWPGMAGDGWATPWEVDSNASSVRNKRVRADEPLADGEGAYVQFESQDPPGSPSDRQIHHARSYEAHGDFDSAQPHTVSFLYRPDDTQAFVAGGSSFVEVFDAPARSGGNRTWLIRSFGGENKQWAVWDGDGKGQYNPQHAVRTGMTIEAGHTYRMTVDVEPASNQYTVAIEDLNSGEQFDSPSLGFVTDGPVAGRLNFGVQIGDVGQPGTPGSYTFSLDAISLTGSAAEPQ
jgi:hypothetical protein